TDWKYKAKILWRSLIEQQPLLSSSPLVKVGKNVNIHPTAQITGPTIIGDNVTIGAGVIIDACIIGDNVNISQGAQLHISVVGSGCFLPFRAALFMTTVMERTMIAQNTCLQLCVVGRDSFIGAGSTFTDTSVLTSAIKALNGNDELEEVSLRVIGGCVGHHCHLGSGLVIYPARIIESDVILIPSEKRQFIKTNIMYEDSDHHAYGERFKNHPRLYRRQEKNEEQSQIPILVPEGS
ncbi:MAG: multidrug transporter, partial [Chloroflexota bacterium]